MKLINVSLKTHIMTQKEFERRLIELDVEKQKNEMDLRQDIDDLRREIRVAKKVYQDTESRVTPKIRVLENEIRLNSMDFLERKASLYRQFEEGSDAPADTKNSEY